MRLPSTPSATPKQVPDECERKNCTDTPTKMVTYTGPRETVYYCRDHAYEFYRSMDKARSINPIPK